MGYLERLLVQLIIEDESRKSIVNEKRHVISLYFLHNSIYRCHFNWLTEEVTYSWLQVHSIVSHLIVYGSEIIHDPAFTPI